VNGLRGKLNIVELPWKISPSISDFRIEIVENGDAAISAEAAVLPQHNPLTEALENRRVVMVFSGGQWVWTRPAFSDSTVIPPHLFEGYDDGYLPGQSINEFLLESRKKWVASGLCPRPGVYRVENSVWLEEENASRFGCRHYVLEGHDMWIEVIAKSFEWRWSGPSTAQFLDPALLPRLEES
jgi:hypothetical protein